VASGAADLDVLDGAVGAVDQVPPLDDGVAAALGTRDGVGDAGR
jgi:hypothetical protein